MQKPEKFEDLEAWPAARELTNEAYRLARREPMSRDFGLCDQFRRAALSVMKTSPKVGKAFMWRKKNSFIIGRAVPAVKCAQ